MIKFQKFKPLNERLKVKGPFEVFYRKKLKNYQHNTRKADLEYLRLLIELAWFTASRPYYKMYPCMDSLVNRVTKQELNQTHLLFPKEVPTVDVLNHKISVVNFQHPEFSALYATIDEESFMALKEKNKTEMESITGLIDNKHPISSELIVHGPNDEKEQIVCLESDDHYKDHVFVLGSLAAIHMLKDTEFFEPELMKHDIGKKPTTTLIKKAKKHGVVGWALGRSIQTTPHIRRPHFGFRWMGKKTEGQKKVLRPIKGSVVKRKTVTEIPHGYSPTVEQLKKIK